MSDWREDKGPSDFLELLYSEEGSTNEEETSDELENFHDEGEAWNRSREAPYYDLPTYIPTSRRVTSSDRHERLPETDELSPLRTASLNQSRTPIESNESSESVMAPSDVLLRITDKDSQLMDTDDNSVFLSPDSHNVSNKEPERKGNERRSSKQRCIGYVRQRARGRGYPNQGREERKTSYLWAEGRPLNEVWPSDNDVPPELINLAMDVLKREQIRTRDVAKADKNSIRQNARDSENKDEFHYTSNGADFLPRLEDSNIHFEWSTMESFQGQEETFKPEHTGPVRVFDSAYDAFRSYWGDDVLGLIVAETNLYATKIASASFQSEWYPTNIHEIMCLFSFWMMLGIIKMPTIVSCFSVDPLLKTEVFRRIFTRKRYEMLTRAIHFLDSVPVVKKSSPSNTSAASCDRLHRLRPIITHLNSKFQSNYVLDKDIFISESLTHWKPKTQASKFGIKTLELCESTTGYRWNLIVYSDKQSAIDLEQSPSVLKSIAIVKELIGPLLNKGYRLFIDTCYNSPLLARFLKLNGTDCVGTLRPACRDIPVIINDAPLKWGEFVARHSGDVSVLSWQDKKRVTMISTCHGSSIALPRVSSRLSFRPVTFKPQMVLDYNKFMGGLDVKDQMLEPYLFERQRCSKCYMKLFKRLVNVSILNSRILLQSSTQKHQGDDLAFRLKLVDSILTNHLSHCPQRRKFNVSSIRSTHGQPNRFVNSTHWPVLLEQTETSAARNRNFWKRCFVCLRQGKKSQKTPYCCESCRVPLCIKNCFKLYHTQK